MNEVLNYVSKICLSISFINFVMLEYGWTGLFDQTPTFERAIYFAVFSIALNLIHHSNHLEDNS
jgi:hypothetical protein